MRRLVGSAAFVAIALTDVGARAGDAEHVASPRAIGRAGAAAVSEDGSPALLINPAGLARRKAVRASAGIVVSSPKLTHRAAGAPEGAPTIRDRPDAAAAPAVGAQAGVGDFVLGAALLQAPGRSAALPAPAFGADPDEAARVAPHRYAGLSLSSSRRTFAAGAAWRARSWLAIGAAATVADVALEERRAVWAGSPPRDAPGDPRGDLILELGGRDRFVPGVSAGFLAAPASHPIEVAASIQASAGASLRGDASLARARDEPFPAPRHANPSASLDLRAPLVARAGVRYLGERVLAELGVDLTHQRGGAPAWSIAGVQVADDLGEVADLDEVAASPARRTRGALRAAVDVAVVPGFAWATAGYAYATAGADESDFRPTFAAPATHTGALGFETTWDDVTISLGYARSAARAVDVAGGSAAVEAPLADNTPGAGDGRYRVRADRVGFSLDVAFR